MLWTDGVFITQDDLGRIDSELSVVAAAENITLTGANGLLRGAIEELANEMMKLVISFGGYLNAGDTSSNHLAAVLNIGSGNSVRQKVGLAQIVISSDVVGQWSWLKQWAVFWALKTFYRDAFGRVGGDRYKNKMEYYKEEIHRRITPTVWALGVPIVLRPLARPGALFERESGTWDNSNVTLVSGLGTLSTNSYFDVGITYCSMAGSGSYVSATAINNSESGISETLVQGVDVGQVINIDITSLNPPTGTQHPAQLMVVVMSLLKATHWNVYIGQQGGTLYLQNTMPIPVTTKVFTLSGDPKLSGFTPGLGQYPDRRLSLVPTRQRA